MREPSWVRWFDRLPEDDKRTVALNALERLLEQDIIRFWQDDSVDRFGQPIPDGPVSEAPEECLYWNDEHEEDLRIPF